VDAVDLLRSYRRNEVHVRQGLASLGDGAAATHTPLEVGPR